MAILMVLEVEGATEDDYRAINEHMGTRGDEDAPDGLVSHVAGRTENGMLAVDVWQSEEALTRFFEERAGAAFAARGFEPGAPTILPVHNLIAQGAGTAAGVIVLIDAPEIDPGTYDAMGARMDAHAGDQSNHPAVSHVAAVKNGGLFVVDVWDSPDAFGAFARSEIVPAGEAVGIAPLEPRLVPAINRIRGAA